MDLAAESSSSVDQRRRYNWAALIRTLERPYKESFFHIGHGGGGPHRADACVNAYTRHRNYQYYRNTAS